MVEKEEKGRRERKKEEKKNEEQNIYIAFLRYKSLFLTDIYTILFLSALIIRRIILFDFSWYGFTSFKESSLQRGGREMIWNNIDNIPVLFGQSWWELTPSALKEATSRFVAMRDRRTEKFKFWQLLYHVATIVVDFAINHAFDIRYIRYSTFIHVIWYQ